MVRPVKKPVHVAMRVSREAKAALEELSVQMQEPMSRIVENLILQSARRRGISTQGK